jgi:drug/metabolite transporter (DMT)-like permease
MVCVRDCDPKDPKKGHKFEQPVIQTLQMFIGEMGCWLVIGVFSIVARYKRTSFAINRRSKHGHGHDHLSTPAVETDALLVRDEEDAASEDSTLENNEEDPLATSMTLSMEGRQPLTGWKVTYLALPACCDIAGTTLMNVGLLFVAASIYQMTRGALVLFVGVFSVLFLKRHLGLYKWFALFVVVAGVALVGLAGAIEKSNKGVSTLLVDAVWSLNGKEVEISEVSAAVQTTIGVLLIAAAQIFTATQFVLEESIMEKYAIEPLKAVGWEGIWGFLVTAVGMVVLHFAYGNTAKGKGGYFDAREGLWEVTHFRSIAVSSVLIMISIGYVSFRQDTFLARIVRLTDAVASTSSASPLHALSQPRPAAPSTPAAPSSSGL